MSHLGPNGVVVIFGTYNRLESLQRAVKSIRAAVGSRPYETVVIDAGSTDGTREWLLEQDDVVLVGQRGPLSGAVRAFNLGFSYAVDIGAPFVCHFNDDAEFETPSALSKAAEILEQNARVGEVAFEFDLYPGRSFDQIHGDVYANFGLVRLEAGMDVARAQGDSSGRLWWNPMYRTYAADCEFACWLRRLGWGIHPGEGLKIHDLNIQDELRELNKSENDRRGDSRKFWERWEHREWTVPVVRLANVVWKNSQVLMGADGVRIGPNWIRLDHPGTPRADIEWSSWAELSCIPSASVARLIWSHGPDCVPVNEVPGILKELHRILIPGSKFFIVTVGLDSLLHPKLRPQSIADLNAGLFVGHGHRYSGFSTGVLMNLVTDAGFKGVKPWDEKFPDLPASRLPTALRIEGIA